MFKSTSIKKRTGRPALRSASRSRGLPALRAQARQAGFTLIEMLVALTLFAIVMVICVGALLALVGANKKAQALESVMNDLNVSLDEMARSVREGTNFDGSSGCSSNGDSDAKDCTGGTQTFSYAPYGSTDPTHADGRTVYAYAAYGTDGCVTSTKTGGCLVRSENGGSFSPITGPNITIPSNGLEFYIVGTTSGCDSGSGSTCAPVQPRVIIVIDGTADGGSVKDSTSFHLQVTAVQRVLDL